MSVTKSRLLIPMTQHFVVRYLIRTGMLKKMTEYSQPIIAMTWEDLNLQKEIELIGAEVFIIPAFKFSNNFEHVRARINYWHRGFRKTTTTKIDGYRNSLFLDNRENVTKKMREIKMTIEGLRTQNIDRLISNEDELFWHDTNVEDFQFLFEQAKPSAIFSITPFDNQEEPILRLAKRDGLTLTSSILSFDNITTRTWIPVTFQHYMLWNKFNKQELLRAYPEVRRKDITISGPPQFDFYWDKKYIWDEHTWREELALPVSAPVIFWGSGYVKIVPNEPSLLLDLDKAISSGRIPGRPIILFRRHPVDSNSRWESILNQCKNVIEDKPWAARETLGKTDISLYDIEKLVSTLYYSNVHVNVSSTLTIDGAIFNKPQIGPAYDPELRYRYNRVLKELYLREHYLPITKSGGLDIPKNINAFEEAVRTALTHPEKNRIGRKKMVKEICTYVDGKSTDRVVNSLKNNI